MNEPEARQAFNVKSYLLVLCLTCFLVGLLTAALLSLSTVLGVGMAVCALIIIVAVVNR